MDPCEMLKALYDFKATFTKTLDFVEGDYFYFYQTNTKQRNWWHVVNIKGETGFVPSNYVTAEKVQPEFFISFLDQAVDSLSRDTTMTKDKQDVLAKLTEKKRQLQTYYKRRYEKLVRGVNQEKSSSSPETSVTGIPSP